MAEHSSSRVPSRESLSQDMTVQVQAIRVLLIVPDLTRGLEGWCARPCPSTVV